MQIIRRQRLPAWGADLLLGLGAGGWVVSVVYDSTSHPKPFRTRTEAEREFDACVDSDRQLSRECRVSARTAA